MFQIIVEETIQHFGKFNVCKLNMKPLPAAGYRSLAQRLEVGETNSLALLSGNRMCLLASHS